MKGQTVVHDGGGMPVARVISAFMFSQAGLRAMLETAGYELETGWTLAALSRRAALVVLCLPAHPGVLPELLWRVALSIQADASHCRLVIVSDCPTGWIQRTLWGLMRSRHRPQDVRILRLTSCLSVLRLHFQSQTCALWPVALPAGQDENVPALSRSELDALRSGPGSYVSGETDREHERLVRGGFSKLRLLLRVSRRMNRQLRLIRRDLADGHAGTAL